MVKSFWWGGWVGLLGGWVGGFCWFFASKIEDVLAEDSGLLHVLPLALHLKFFLTDK